MRRSIPVREVLAGFAHRTALARASRCRRGRSAILDRRRRTRRAQGADPAGFRRPGGEAFAGGGQYLDRSRRNTPGRPTKPKATLPSRRRVRANAPAPHSLGSGFIISKGGYILTNDHVIENAQRIMVTLQDGHEYRAKRSRRAIGKTDVALIKIEAPYPLPVAPLGNSDDVRVGEWVMAIGNPFGFDHSVTAGIVSAKGRFIPGNYDDFIQTDASINPGNSGGPLIDLHGAVIGVNSAIYTRTGSNMGIGFAIPVNLVKGELPQLRDDWARCARMARRRRSDGSRRRRAQGGTESAAAARS